MKYKDIQVGEVFEQNGYKWMKILTEDGIRNMRLTTNLKCHEFFSHIGNVFMETDKVNFSSFWEYKSDIDFTKFARYYYVGSTVQGFVFRVATDANYYFVKTFYKGNPIYVAVHAEGDRFKTGFTYELDDTITCEMVDEKIFYYNEGEENEIRGIKYWGLFSVLRKHFYYRSIFFWE